MTTPSAPPHIPPYDLTTTAPSISAPPIPGPGSSRDVAEVRAAIGERLPELLATAGAMLVVTAVAGFVVSQWQDLGNLGQAAILVAGSVGLTVQGLFASERPNRLLARLVPLSWGSAAGLTLVAVRLLLDLGLSTSPRLAILGAGLVAAGHAGWAWQRRPDSVVLQVATVASAIFAVGPFGASLADDYGIEVVLAWLAGPIAALFGGDVVASADGFALVAGGHLLVAIAWIWVALRLSDLAASRVGRIGGALLLAWSAMELNAMQSPIGSALGLLVVIAFLIVGISLKDSLLIAFGVVAGIATGLRTTWSLFTGETAVTLTVAIAGVAILAGALRLARGRDEDDISSGDQHGPGPGPDAAPTAHRPIAHTPTADAPTAHASTAPTPTAPRPGLSQGA